MKLTETMYDQIFHHLQIHKHLTWLAHHLFYSIDEVQNFGPNWFWSYNHERPNMAIGSVTPKQKLAKVA